MITLLLVMGGLVFLMHTQQEQKNVVLSSNESAAQLITTKAKTSMDDEMKIDTPVRLSIKSLTIDVDIKPGTYDSRARTWTLDNHNVFMMEGSRTPLIYGHNKTGIFKNLSNITRGDILHITDRNGYDSTFSYITAFNVSPSESNFLNDSHPNTLLLMTCTGPKFEARSILVFTYEPTKITESELSRL